MIPADNSTGGHHGLTQDGQAQQAEGVHHTIEPTTSAEESPDTIIENNYYHDLSEQDIGTTLATDITMTTGFTPLSASTDTAADDGVI